MSSNQKIPDGPMKTRFYRVLQFAKVVLATILVDGILTGIYFSVKERAADWLIIRPLYAFAFDSWYILFFSLVLTGLSWLFPRSMGSLKGQLVTGLLIGGLAGLFLFSQFLLVYPSLSYSNLIETLLFAIVGCSCGFLHWYFITKPVEKFSKSSGG